MTEDSLHLGLDMANRIFTCARSSSHNTLLAILHDADSTDQHLEIAEQDELPASDCAPDQIPVVCFNAVDQFRDGRLLTVITNTKGVLEIKAFRVADGVLRAIEIVTQ